VAFGSALPPFSHLLPLADPCPACRTTLEECRTAGSRRFRAPDTGRRGNGRLMHFCLDISCRHAITCQAIMRKLRALARVFVGRSIDECRKNVAGIKGEWSLGSCRLSSVSLSRPSQDFLGTPSPPRSGWVSLEHQICPRLFALPSGLWTRPKRKYNVVVQCIAPQMAILQLLSS